MSDERVRLFVALELPDTARDALSDWRDRALSGAPGLRSLSADSLHVTLCFLGWRDGGEVASIAGACGELSSEAAPRLSLGGARWLPPRRPRVLAVELRDPSEALAGVQSALSARLAAGGWYRPEKRPYLAHVTVARVARGGRVPREPLPPVPPLDFGASIVTLFRSRLMRGGAAYEPLARIELRC